MSHSAIRDALVTLVDGVTGTGLVHGRERRPAEMGADEWRAIFQPTDTGPLHGWIVYRTGVREEVVTHDEQSNQLHTFVVEGWYSFDDTNNSDATWEPFVDAVSGALRFPEDLSGAAFNVARVETIASDRATLSDTLCHHVAFAVDVYERVLGPNTDDAVPSAPTATTYDELMDLLATTLGASPISADTVSRGRNFPLKRDQRHALMVRLDEEEVERASDLSLKRFPIRVELSYDVLDSPGTDSAATGEDAARHVSSWLDTLITGYHRKTSADVVVTGMVISEVGGVVRPSVREAADGPWIARVDASCEVSATVWTSVA